MKRNLLVLALVSSLFCACGDDDVTSPANPVVLQNHSKTPHMLELKPEFSDVEIFTLISSEDKLSESPDFVYGSMADGAGLLKNSDGTFTLINNIEADYSIARITLDETFKPVKGEYIVNSDATANTAQCSGSLITPEEHGFGPLYLSGGEWGGSSTNVFVTDPFKSAAAASSAKTLVNFGQWTTENAVVLGKDAFPGKTVALIGDDSHGEAGGQLAMYVSNSAGDLDNGKLYGLKVGDGTVVDNDLIVDQEYDVTFVELNERTYDALNDEAIAKKVMAFNRVEDIDYRKGSGEANREFYFNATGRSQFNDTRTLYGRVYKIVLNENDPTKGTLTLVLDGDNLNGKAKSFHSPDNILVTENYAYIQEDPNGYDNDVTKQHDAYLYQYNLKTGEVKTVLEVDRDAYISGGYGSANDGFGTWELTGMIDISDEIGIEGSFLLIVQAHSWHNDAFLNPDGAGTDENSSDQGSYAVVLKGLER
ncbi:phosphatase [Fulvivirga sp. 29W222]|uniref:Phosphatase n=1 Tax=Fulvivirga marina TaxID=2494733 RepID=A0A937KG38_9BACT|nr:phosphatase [Fulvivirga marina]MBL6448788.1 phosphatase [Fulvivirga marina]